MNIDNAQLAAFAMVLREGSFEAAARRLNVTPSAISQRIKLLEERQSKRPDSTYTLRWEPMYARAAESGELGYTYGTWELKINADSSNISRGTYVTIWKRQPNGEWKYVLDSGQDGLGEEKK